MQPPEVHGPGPAWVPSFEDVIALLCIGAVTLGIVVVAALAGNAYELYCWWSLKRYLKKLRRR